MLGLIEVTNIYLADKKPKVIIFKIGFLHITSNTESYQKKDPLCYPKSAMSTKVPSSEFMEPSKNLR